MTNILKAIDARLKIKNHCMTNAPFDRMITVLSSIYTTRGPQRVTKIQQAVLYDESTASTDIFHVLGRTSMRLIFVACRDRIK